MYVAENNVPVDGVMGRDLEDKCKKLFNQNGDLFVKKNTK